MASPEHLTLSEFLRNVHQQLRNTARIVGGEEAWTEHCKNRNLLQEYAKAMHKLATNHWESNLRLTSASCRNIWTCKVCDDYFKQGNILHFRQRDLNIAEKLFISLDSQKTINKTSGDRIELLDVGSCYNPFGTLSEFSVLPIDIAPATEKVKECDFLNVSISEHNLIIEDESVKNIQTESFDVVLFSLLLEYIPTPEQRLSCCRRAYDVLRYEGILIIITPDSKHVGANAKYMKSWQHALADLGFTRIKYEKLQHVHCMAFRKCLHEAVSKRWSDLHAHNKVYDGVYIPQDFNCV